MEHRKLISTKADTLFALRSLIHESVIEEMYILQVGDYHRDKIGVCHEIMDQFRGRRIVVALPPQKILSSVLMRDIIKVFWMWILPVSRRSLMR